jgi:RND family efflux transporter MFP subunit
MTISIRRLLAPVLVIAGGAGIYALLHATKPEPEKSNEEPRPTSVYTSPVQQSDEVLQVTTQGEVRSRTHLNIVAQVSGRIVEVSPEFVEGGVVNPGEPLLVIEDADYELALRQAEAAVAEAEVAVQQALADADVARQQLRNDPNPSDLALKKPQVAQARAAREAALANLEQARLNLARTRVTLPFAGRIVNTRVDLGQFITTGTVLGEVFGTEVVEIRLPLSDGQLAALGLPIGYTAGEGGGLDVELRAEVAGRSHQWTGKLVRLDASIDPDTRMLYAIAEVHDPYGENISANGMPLAVGLFVDATVSGRRVSDAVSIPSSALRAGDVVFLLSDQGRLEIRNVDVAHVGAGTAVVVSGVEAGEQVITSAIRNPIQGMALSPIAGDSIARDR